MQMQACLRWGKNRRGLFALERGRQPGALPGLCVDEKDNLLKVPGEMNKNAIGIT